MHIFWSRKHVRERHDVGIGGARRCIATQTQRPAETLSAWAMKAASAEVEPQVAQLQAGALVVVVANQRQACLNLQVLEVDGRPGLDGVRPCWIWFLGNLNHVRHEAQLVLVQAVDHGFLLGAYRSAVGLDLVLHCGLEGFKLTRIGEVTHLLGVDVLEVVAQRGCFGVARREFVELCVDLALDQRLDRRDLKAQAKAKTPVLDILANRLAGEEVAVAE